MTERDKRQFQQRLLDGIDRSKIRQEVLRARRKRFRTLKKRYGTLVLGASLAVGGVGIPLKAQRMLSDSDVEAVNRVTREFTSVAEGLTASLDPAAAERQLTLITEAAQKEFFDTEVPFGSLIYAEAQRNDVPPELVAAVVQQESQFKPTARSRAGAQGLMQLMPRTGRWMGASNLLNPQDNVKAGAKYLKYLHERFDGDETKVIAAYNGGEGNVRKYGGIPPFRETRQYVKKVKDYKQDYEEKVAGKIAERIDQEAPALKITH